jgi:hypothetical protein
MIKVQRTVQGFPHGRVAEHPAARALPPSTTYTAVTGCIAFAATLILSPSGLLLVLKKVAQQWFFSAPPRVGAGLTFADQN